MTDTTRDAFEAHVNTFASKNDSPSTRFELCYTGAYENSWVQLGWLYWQSAWQAATEAERERCAMRAAQLAEDAAIIYANGHEVNFNQAVSNPIRNGT